MKFKVSDCQSGFSLIELAIVLVVVGLLLAGGMVALQTTTERQKRSEQNRQFQELREALYGFAVVEGRLPCPDNAASASDADGQEDYSGGTCDAETGALPWVDLGIGRRDAWGHMLLYHVNPDFANPTGEDVVFSLATEADYAAGDPQTIGVNDLDGNRIAGRVIAAVVSFGGQGNQVWTDAAFACPGDGGSSADGFSTEETRNCDKSGLFIAGDYRGAEAADGRFDDIVMWIPDVLLKARMVEAGRLP